MRNKLTRSQKCTKYIKNSKALFYLVKDYMPILGTNGFKVLMFYARIKAPLKEFVFCFVCLALFLLQFV